MVGLAHEDALRFSFLLATPVIGAAAVLKLPGLFASRDAAGIETALLGAAGAATASYCSATFLTRYFKTQTLISPRLTGISYLRRWGPGLREGNRRARRKSRSA